MLGLLFALGLVALSPSFAQAGVQAQELTLTPTPAPTATLDCEECHEDIYDSWEQSAHGQGLSCGQCHLAQKENTHAREGHAAQVGLPACMSCHTTGYNPVTDTWEEDNVHCTACHAPVPLDHPDTPMPTDRTGELCGKCHIQAHFEWQASKHGLAGVSCVSCHNQHAAKLRSDEVSIECAICHGERVNGFSHSAHDDQGLTCADCHLAPLDIALGEGQAKRNHSFEVQLSTCTNCHSYQLHNAKSPPTPQVTVLLSPPESFDAMASNVSVPATDEPDPVAPLGLAATFGVFGVFIGAVAMSQWGQRLLRLRGKPRG